MVSTVIRSLEPSCRVSEETPIEIATGRYVVRLAETIEEIDAALKLRFEVFNLELGEGLDSSFRTGRDRDEFDASCDHLIVTDRTNGNVVGTYRLRTIEMAEHAEVNRPPWLSDTLLVAASPLAGYTLAFVYEAGFLRVFGRWIHSLARGNFALTGVLGAPSQDRLRPFLRLRLAEVASMGQNAAESRRVEIIKIPHPFFRFLVIVLW